VLAACGTSGDLATARPPRTHVPGGIGASGQPSDAVATDDAAATDDATATDDASADPDEPTDAPDATDDPDASDDPDATDTPTGTPGSAAECAGNDENRDFYMAVAGAVDWTVYCPVLGSGWFVESGQYRLAGGGWMEIGYRGPGGARIALREGAPCTAEGCIPTGDDLGTAAFSHRAPS
jgi:hypothetical protein